MRTFGLIGYPLTHSFSQKYFSKKFEDEGIDARYLNFPLSNIGELKGLLEQHPYLAGLNVTIPYKEQFFPFWVELIPEPANLGPFTVFKFTGNKGRVNLNATN